MRSLVRAVQCIKSSQKYRLLDRELPSKVSISERKKERKGVPGAGGEEGFIEDWRGQTGGLITKRITKQHSKQDYVINLER